MINLQVTAKLATPIAVSDSWSPRLDNLLCWLWLDTQGLVSPDPRAGQLIEADIPLQRRTIKQTEFWACSAPFYQSIGEQKIKYRKRWDYQEYHCDWGKKKAKVNTQEGPTKAYDLPLRLLEIPRIDWFCVGNLSDTKELLSRCSHLGKKRSQGKGQVYQWEVREFEHDWSLWKDGLLTRPFPIELIENVGSYPKINMMEWGWKSPAWLPENRSICMMSDNNG